MTDGTPHLRYRFGVFELDASTGELRRKGLRVKLHAQPFQVLRLLLARPGEMLTREQICRELWPADTFVDYEHGVNSAVNRLREALGDKASSPRFVETIARRGYRFVAPVERIETGAAPQTVLAEEGPAEQQSSAQARVPEEADAMAAGVADRPAATRPIAAAAAPSALGLIDRVLAAPEDLPSSSPALVQTLFLLLQGMYLSFYVGALANLPEIGDLLSTVSTAPEMLWGLIASAAVLIPVRVFLVCAVLFRAPDFHRKFRRVWPYLLVADELWALSPFLLLHHLPFGLALACMTLLVYAPFAQRSLTLMGAGRPH